MEIESFIKEYINSLSEKNIDEISSFFHYPAIVMNRRAFTPLVRREDLRQFYKKLHDNHICSASGSGDLFVIKSIKKISGSFVVVNISLNSSASDHGNLEFAVLLMNVDGAKKIVVQNFHQSLDDSMFSVSKAEYLKNKNENMLMNLASLME